MRDGVKLFTAVYVPKDDSQDVPDPADPHAVQRRPVRRRTSTPTRSGPATQFAKAGYIFVYQDVRGRWMSEGEFVNMRPHNPAKKAKEIDESSDTYDTIDWLLKNVKGTTARSGRRASRTPASTPSRA